MSKLNLCEISQRKCMATPIKLQANLGYWEVMKQHVHTHKAKACLPLLLILAICLLFACGSPASTTSHEEPSVPSGSTAISQNEPSKPPHTILADRVDVVYFHRPRRCVTCLCFEERIRYVMKTYFQNELNNGELTFQVCGIGDRQNAAIVKKYGAIGSHLFINTVSDGTDHIRDIQEIWSWHCTSDKQGFDQKVKNVIEQSLRSGE